MRIKLSISSGQPNIAPSEIEIEGTNVQQIDDLIGRIHAIRNEANI